MPRIWFQAQQEQPASGEWTAVSLDGREQCDGDDDDSGGGGGLAQLTLLRTTAHSESGEQWVALLDAQGSLRINGEMIPLGLRVLRDRDAIQTAGQCAGTGVAYFSTQSTPVVTPLPGEKAVACARCRKKIHPGTPCVRCPACGAIHHQTSVEEGLICWTYHTHCARCQRQATALDDCEAWTPKEL